jgi:hypothetical protein
VHGQNGQPGRSGSDPEAPTIVHLAADGVRPGDVAGPSSWWPT